MGRRRVFFFDAYPHLLGGGQLTTLLLARELPSRGWPTEVVVPGEGPLVERLHQAGVATTVIPAPPALSHYGGATRGRRAALAAAALPGYWTRVRRAVRSGALLHAADQRGMLLAAPAARLARRPVIWHVHHRPDVSSLLVLACRLLASRVILPSRTVADDVPSLRDADVVPYACAEPIPAVYPRRAPGRFRIVSTGRLVAEKGYDVLLDAVSRAGIADVDVEIAGAAQEGHNAHYTALLAQRERLGLTDNVTFAGHVERPWLRWSGASVYVQPSRYETFGIALAEAMAAGLPVVASRAGGMAELVRHGDTGLLVAPGDATALARALRRIAEDPELARRLGRQARQEVLGSYTVDRMLDRVTTIYEALARS